MTPTKAQHGNIEVPALARVEGEGGLFIGVDNGKISEIRVDIYEPPRFFEGFLRGRSLYEVPDITARICGICPVAYQMSAAHALEAAQGITITPSIRAMRHLFYCAEWIESHALHMFLLQAPDLLGQESAISLAAVNPEIVTKALRMKKIGNAILRVIGGRSVHPLGTSVGGFYRWPPPEEFQALLPELEWALEASLETVRWAATLPYPKLSIQCEYVSLSHPDEYAILDGDVVSSGGRRIPIAQFAQTYLEEHVRHSNALHNHTPEGKSYMVGPLARLNNNHARLHTKAAGALKATGIKLPIRNPFMALFARAVELVEAYDEAIRLIRAYDPQGPSRVEFEPHAGEGCGATEAPRGLLFHRYSVDDQGLIQSALIIPPTAQNLARMEADLWEFAPTVLNKSREEATLDCEHLVRAYDPCISCATHFVRMEDRNAAP
jgi:coenzyme F420-reducing hydrogenase alpha subunit